MTRGILRWDSSLMAICSASVSPSSGTSTGAFILRSEQHGFIRDVDDSQHNVLYTPDLQCSRPQYTRTLILGQVRRCDAHFVGLSLPLHTRPRLGGLRGFTVLWFLGVRTVRAVCQLALASRLAVWQLCGEQVVVLILAEEGWLYQS